MASVTTCSLILKLLFQAQISLLSSKCLFPITDWTSLQREDHVNKCKHVLHFPITNSLPFYLYSSLGLKVSPSLQDRNVGIMLDFSLILALWHFSHCNFPWNQFPLGTFSLNPYSSPHWSSCYQANAHVIILYNQTNVIWSMTLSGEHFKDSSSNAQNRDRHSLDQHAKPFSWHLPIFPASSIFFSIP